MDPIGNIHSLLDSEIQQLKTPNSLSPKNIENMEKIKDILKNNLFDEKSYIHLKEKYFFYLVKLDVTIRSAESESNLLKTIAKIKEISVQNFHFLCTSREQIQQNRNLPSPSISSSSSTISLLTEIPNIHSLLLKKMITESRDKRMQKTLLLGTYQTKISYLEQDFSDIKELKQKRRRLSVYLNAINEEIENKINDSVFDEILKQFSEKDIKEEKVDILIKYREQIENSDPKILEIFQLIDLKDSNLKSLRDNKEEFKKYIQEMSSFYADIREGPSLSISTKDLFSLYEIEELEIFEIAQERFMNSLINEIFFKKEIEIVITVNMDKVCSSFQWKNLQISKIELKELGKENETHNAGKRPVLIEITIQEGLILLICKPRTAHIDAAVISAFDQINQCRIDDLILPTYQVVHPMADWNISMLDGPISLWEYVRGENLRHFLEQSKQVVGLGLRRNLQRVDEKSNTPYCFATGKNYSEQDLAFTEQRKQRLREHFKGKIPEPELEAKVYQKEEEIRKRLTRQIIRLDAILTKMGIADQQWENILYVEDIEKDIFRLVPIDLENRQGRTTHIGTPCKQLSEEIDYLNKQRNVCTIVDNFNQNVDQYAKRLVLLETDMLNRCINYQWQDLTRLKNSIDVFLRQIIANISRLGNVQVDHELKQKLIEDYLKNLLRGDLPYFSQNGKKVYFGLSEEEDAFLFEFK